MIGAGIVLDGGGPIGMTGHEEARMALLLARMTPPRGSNSGHVVLSWPDDLLVKRLLARLTMRQPPLAWPEAWGLLVWNDGGGIVSHPGPPTLWDRLQMLAKLARSLGAPGLE